MLYKVERLQQVTPPGATIRDEIEARGWTTRRLAQVMGSSERYVRELIHGRRALTPETALRLEAALEIDADFWIRLEGAYRLRLEEEKGSVNQEEIGQRRIFVQAT